MRIILSLLTCLISSALPAQTDNWKVSMNTRTLLVTTEENPEKNTIILSRSDLVKKGFLQVSYSEKHPEKGWRREISVVDSKENELVKRGSSRLIITHNQLKSIIAKGITVFHIYSWTLPVDPAKAALVRVRRVHLCTIVVK